MEQITITEALEQGYTHCMREDSEYASRIGKVDLTAHEYFVCEKEPVPFKIHDTLILDLIDSYLQDQDEVYDESGKLNELAASCDFTGITEQINKAFEQKKFHVPTRIKIIPY